MFNMERSPNGHLFVVIQDPHNPDSTIYVRADEFWPELRAFCTEVEAAGSAVLLTFKPKPIALIASATP